MQDILLERYIKEVISKEEELEKFFYEFVLRNSIYEEALWDPLLK